jgi:protein-disulfide isomerase
MNRIVVVGIGIVVALAAAGGIYWTQSAKAPQAAGSSAPVMASSSNLGVPINAAARAEVYQPDGLLPENVLGNPDAPVTIVEYASLTCPHCAAFQATTAPALKRDYVDTGKVKLIYRDFPLDNLAAAAAMLAHCGGPERYFGFIEILFRSQMTWATSQNPRAELEKLARLAGVSQEAFDACLKNEAQLRAIQTRAQTASEKFGVESTPTFFVADRKLAGDVPYAELKPLLDGLLSKS